MTDLTAIVDTDGSLINARTFMNKETPEEAGIRMAREVVDLCWPKLEEALEKLLKQAFESKLESLRTSLVAALLCQVMAPMHQTQQAYEHFLKELQKHDG